MKKYDSQVFVTLNKLDTAAYLYHIGEINKTEFEEMKKEIMMQAFKERDEINRRK